ncbi:Electron transfer flavoprotein FAD-binding domain protein [Desulfosarcina cetonica]|uniref:FAD-binding protein n=1 Tax=Desulfosarcina cetonica TaxID=90730 RepID=UPI0006CF4B78|nr:FAD-binding protein [Desulfosarcina cetonica]VTR65398.1 Electron transfer flavoprotein FAD-binding domain protein [Desulfosarcina cetonica]
MTNATTNEIWVFGDLRSDDLLTLSMKVVVKAAELARQTADRVILFALKTTAEPLLTLAADEACAVREGGIDAEAFAWGADEVLFFENDAFASPMVHPFTHVLTPQIKERRPRLVLFPLTDFGRDLAARTAAACRAGLMADCIALKQAEDGAIVGLCPAWGGEVMAEITYAAGHGTGFATVQPHGATGTYDRTRSGRTTRIGVDCPPPAEGIRRISSQRAPVSAEDLENARTVVVGGAGLGTIENFSAVRQLAAALTGQLAATRPPVLNHWIAEDRLIGQTGKTVRPDLLISVGTSGAVQYTAGIMDAGTIVAINRDPAAPIFRIADIGVVADATSFLPVLTTQIQQTVMRRLADDICVDGATPTEKRGFGEKIKHLRQAKNWTREQLADATGQTPEFITSVESGDVSPPVAFLLRLSTAYGVDPGMFLREDEKAQIRDQRTQAYVNRTRNYSYQTLTSGAEHDHLRAFMITIEPHHDHKPVAYKHDGEEFIFVMEGRLQFTLGSKVHTLNQGESIHFHSNTPHKLKSLSAEITRCLVILYTL